MNEFVFYLMGLLGMFSAACALWLAIELKRTEKELEEASELLSLPIPEPKIETYRLATLHAWVEVDAQMEELMKPEELDDYLRAHLAQKIAEGIKPRLKIEKKRATMFGIQYETELTIKEEKPCAPLTPIR